MSYKAILVTQQSGTDPLRFSVLVREGVSETCHDVSLSAADLAALGATSGAALVEAAFAFLLDREPKEAILSRFDVSVIARYFPDFPQALPNYLNRRP